MADEVKEKKVVGEITPTFTIDCRITGYDGVTLPSDDPTRPPAVWHRLSVADGKGLSWVGVTADKGCLPEKVRVFAPYRVGFKVIQEVNKNENTFFRLKIVTLQELTN